MQDRTCLETPFAVPPVCCICQKPATTAIPARYSCFVPLVIAVSVTSARIDIPFCKEHAEPVRRKMRNCKIQMILNLMLMVGLFVYTSNAARVPQQVMLLPFVFLGLAIYFGFKERRQMPVRLVNAFKEDSKEYYVLESDHPEFLKAVREANSADSQRGSPSA